MQVIARTTLRKFWDKHPHAETPLSAWYAIASKADWNTPADVKAAFGTNVDFVGDNRIIFDIGGNKFRLIVRVSYEYKRVLIKFIDTHRDYDKINPETV